MTGTFDHHHLLDIERLSVADINAILDLAEHYAAQNRSPNKKTSKLTGKTIVNLFVEPSTRTRVSFEIAAKRLGADVINVPVEQSSLQKGETLSDTVANLDAMQIDALVIRHPENGVPQFVAPQMKASVINAGDGTHEHPTQALLDALTIRRHKKNITGLTVTICGDIAHSRVARSNIALLNKLGADVRTVAPPYFATDAKGGLGVENFEKLQDGINGADVIMMLRIQHERLTEGLFPVSLKKYHEQYGLDHKKLSAARADVIVMHPGPVHRDVELSSALADDPKFSVIREQVELGVAVRMAILDLLLSKR